MSISAISNRRKLPAGWGFYDNEDQGRSKED
jgi:hypothetical protein